MLFVVRCRCDLLIISIKQAHMVRKKEKWYLPSPAQNSVGIILMQRRGDTEGTSVCLGSFRELLAEARATSAHTRVQCHRTAPEPTLHQAPRTKANSTSSLNKAAETHELRFDTGHSSAPLAAIPRTSYYSVLWLISPA